MQSVPSIFVSIASYRDPELIPTLHDMINTAERPENLNIAIFWQNDNDINTFLNQGMQLIERTTHQGYPLYQLEYNRARVSVLSVHYYEVEGHAGPGTWPKPCSRMKHSFCRSILTVVSFHTGITK